MKFNLQTIRNNSLLVYGLMKRMYHYSFDELEKLCGMKVPDLCLALVELQREGKVTNSKDERGVYYARLG